MRPSMHAWVMSERYHDSMGSKGGETRALLAMKERGKEIQALAVEKQRRRGYGQMYQGQRERPLFIGGGGVRGELSTSIHMLATSHHFASPKIVRMPPLAAPSKDASDDSSPHSMGRELP